MINSSLTVKIIFIVFLLVPMLIPDLPESTLIANQIQNTGHIFIFSIISLVVLLIFKTVYPSISFRNYKLYIYTFSISLMTGVSVEIIQSFIGRDAGLNDIMLDITGIVSTLGLYYLYKSYQHDHLKVFSAKNTVLLCILLAQLIYATRPLFSLSLAYYARNNSFPILVDFRSDWADYFVKTENSVISKDNYITMKVAGTKISLVNVVFNAKELAQLSSIEPVSDWTSYSKLCFIILLHHNTPIDITIRIHDLKHNYQHEDRFNNILTLNEFTNNYCIPLSLIQHAPAKRKLDLENIANITFFTANNNKDDISLYLSDIWLQ